ncbi:MAG: hypothetical protein ACLGH8_09365 [Bacteroidia bacterium]
MKTIYIIIMFACAFTALYQQSQHKPNPFIMVPCILVFMLGLMKLMRKVPGKHERNDQNEV